VLHHVTSEVVAHLIGVPAGVAQEVLDPSRPRLADGFGHLPAVLAPNVFKQSGEVAIGSLADLGP